ncbi:MAG: type II toxin-antitoxin system VapC family toxin [Spirochaetia bacterium]|jgi:tRNA(fMet)-specific endonuclease VapC|nr:type II toxin-antitoxin system VapC family toxin [Spirochaetia bacterium]
MKSILLDTNAYSAILRNQGESVLDAIDGVEKLFLSVVVIGELYAGFREGARFRENVRTLKEFMSDSIVSVADVNEETAEIFGEIKSALKKQGTPIPLNDIWIAAQCVELGAVLVTFDKTFSNIPGLRIWGQIG